MQRRSWLLWAIALVLLAAGVKVWKKMPPYQGGFHNQVVEAANRSTAPVVDGCPIFPADNVWNTPIDKLRKDQRADAYVDSIGALKGIHPDFGSNLNSGIPFTEVPDGTRFQTVTFENRDESDLGKYPIPKDAPIEGGPHDENGDRHVIVIDQHRCILYETWLTRVQADGSWIAGSGIRMDLTDNALRRDTWTSADAAGLPIFPGLVRYDEVASGEINHALRFTLAHTQKGHIWPARHQSSNASDINLPPMGTRFRLRADFDISKYSKTNQVIMVALKRYGMFMADNGSSMYLSGVSDKRWDDSDLHKLAALHAEDFEAVDESAWQLLPDSARVDPVMVQRDLR